PDADVHVVDEERRGEGTHVLLDAFGHRARMDFSFTGGHYLRDALAAVAAFVELGYRLDQAAAPSPRCPAGVCSSTTPTTPTPSP
ncbi:MAG: hypothetical protein ACM3MJ_03630, partial [Deltaproteobacteria bacterium]